MLWFCILILCSFCLFNEVVKRDEKEMFYLDRGGEGGSLEALRRLWWWGELYEDELGASFDSWFVYSVCFFYLGFHDDVWQSENLCRFHFSSSDYLDASPRMLLFGCLELIGIYLNLCPVMMLSEGLSYWYASFSLLPLPCFELPCVSYASECWFFYAQGWCFSEGLELALNALDRFKLIWSLRLWKV